MKKLKILHISTFDRGGASAVIRLHHYLLKKGLESDYLTIDDFNKNVLRKHIYKPISEKNTFMDRIKSKLGLKNPHSFYDQQGIQIEGYPLGYGFTFPQTLNKDICKLPIFKQADIIHLHWVNKMIDYPSFFDECKKPIVWTLHDMHPFTGGLYYSIGTNYTENQLVKYITPETNSLDKLLNQHTKIKAKAVENSKIEVAATSSMMKKLSENSVILGKFKHHLIPLGIDTDIFRPYSKKLARNVFGLKEHGMVLVFVSAQVDNRFKGLSALTESLRYLPADIQILAVGNESKNLQDSHRNITFTGTIYDERLMALAYSAGDLFVTPSLQEAFGQTTIEAQACGVPVLAFQTWGSADLVENGTTGIISKETTVEALAENILDVHVGKIVFDSQYIREQAVEKYDLTNYISGYLKLYDSF